MSKEQLYRMRSQNRETIFLSGAFRPNSSSGVVSGSSKGKGWSVARTSAGLYTITLADKYPAMVSGWAGVREAAGKATFCQLGDYVAASKTVQLRLMQAGAGSARGKSFPLDIFGSRFVSKTKIRDLGGPGQMVLASTPPTLDTKVGGLAFDADNEKGSFSFRVPDDWNGSSDMYLRLKWTSEHGTPILNGQTVIWETDYYCAASEAAIDAAGAASVDTTYTEAEAIAGADEELIHTDTLIDYNHADQPLVKGQHVYMTISRDKSTDTYANDAVLVGMELVYTAFLSPLAILDGLPVASDEPYITRVNGPTDPALRLVWPAGSVNEVLLPPVLWPVDLDHTAAAYVKLLAAMSGATDTPTITVKAFEGIGDTNFGGATAALSATPALASRTLAASDIGDPAVAGTSVLNLSVTPGTHNTDAVYLYGGRLNYTSTESPDAFAVADLAADADNEISFCLEMALSSDSSCY
jgi:hypothetical protein